MNRILLAYSHHNAELAQSIDSQLSRIGIPFEHIHDQQAGQIAERIQAEGEPVVLLITDNFLRSRACMEGMLPALQQITAAGQPVLAVVADGKDADGKVLPTHIDRMVNALQFMNHWQNAWLDISTEYQQATGKEKAELEIELDAVRAIANQMGDLIGALREGGYVSGEQFQANDFAVFFQKFGLMDWHGQYRRLVAQLHENKTSGEAVHLPDTPLASGILAPEPMPEPEFPDPEPEPEEELQEEEPEMDIDILADPYPIDTDETNQDEFVEQAIRDAWFWIEKGYTERGLELLQIATEQYPENTRLREEYESASAKFTTSSELPETVSPSIGGDTQPAEPDDSNHKPTEEETQIPANDAKSYDLMGDIAAEKGDYLFAKYCWDRVAELDPAYPGIFRKLGLMTSEHLRDYHETAITYLQKALEEKPKDKEVLRALKQITKEQMYVPENQDAIQAEEVKEEPEKQDAAIYQESSFTAASPATRPESSTLLTVLITGATSGIGRATAELFARNGYRLILTGRRVERLVELKNQFEEQFQSDVLLLPFDVRDSGAVEAALDNLPDYFQEIDILVNNAGLAKGLAPIHEGSLEHWETMIDTNVKGLLYVTRLVTPGMVRRRRGHIINVGSSAGKETYPNGNVYCATKFAVDALTKAMRMDLHAHNIRVSQVSPGHVEETEFALARFDGDVERAQIYQDFQPLKASDVADVIYFMATRSPHVNIQDVQMYSTQQASTLLIDRSGRGE